MGKIFYFCKYGKYIGILGFLTLVLDNQMLNLFYLFWLLTFVEYALLIPLIKCSILQYKGIAKVNKKYGENVPNVDNYKCKVKYSLPFRGEWVVINGCFSKEFSHSWDIPSQRYAYDFIILDKNLKSHDGNLKNVANYYCYEKELLSPADGVVVEVLDNAKDSEILGPCKFYSSARDIRGNYIVIKHATDEFSFLAHIQKDSILVKEGEYVKRGQVIAKCGNTGNSTEPHLHFQLQNGISFYDSVGLPIEFADIEINKPEMYEMYDSRKCISISEIPSGYISRGYMVK